MPVQHKKIKKNMISHISHTSTIQQEMAKLPVKNIWFCQHDDVAVPSTK